MVSSTVLEYFKYWTHFGSKAQLNWAAVTFLILSVGNWHTDIKPQTYTSCDENWDSDLISLPCHPQPQDSWTFYVFMPFFSNWCSLDWYTLTILQIRSLCLKWLFWKWETGLGPVKSLAALIVWWHVIAFYGRVKGRVDMSRTAFN